MKIYKILNILILINICSLNYNKEVNKDFITIKRTNGPHLEDDIEEGDNPDSSSSEPSFLNIGTSLPYAVDYSHSYLLNWIKKGDLMYYYGNSLPNGEPMGHIAIIEGIFWDTTFEQYYIRTIEANGNSGVARGLLSPERFAGSNQILRVEGASTQIIDNVVNFCVSKLGEPYNGHFFSQNVDGFYGYYCSELAWAAYCDNGLDIDGSNAPGVWPYHIKLSNITKTIMDSDCNVNTTFTTNSSEHTFHCDNDTYTENHDHNGIQYQGHDRCSVCGYIFWPSC